MTSYFKFDERSLVFDALIRAGLTSSDSLPSLQFFQVAGRRAVLGVPDALVQNGTREVLGQAGRLCEEPESEGWPLDEMWRHVPPIRAVRPASCDRVLVVPRAGADLADLLDTISAFPSFEVHHCPIVIGTGDADARPAFELRSLGSSLAPLPRVLPGMPDLMRFEDRNYLLSIDHELQLLSHCRFLYPEQPDDCCVAWLPSQEARPWEPDWIRVLGESEPLATRICFSEPWPVRDVGAPVDAAPLEINLQLGYDQRPKSAPKQPARRLYRFRSEDGSIGSRLLELLDLVEAGVKGFSHYCRPIDPDDDTGPVEHYLLARQPVEETEGGYYAERVFVEEPSLTRHGLQVFLPEGLRFRPDIGAALADAAGQEFAARLAEKLGLGDTPDGLAVIEPDRFNKDLDKPVVTLLTQGHELSEAMRTVLDRFNPIARGRATAAALKQESAVVEGCEKQLVETAHNETQALTALAKEACVRLQRLGLSTEGRCAEAEKRLRQAEATLDVTYGRLGKLPDEWALFVELVCKLMADLAAPQYAWLQDLDVAKSKRTELLDKLQVILIDVEARAKQVTEELRNRVKRGETTVEATKQKVREAERLEAETDELQERAEEVAAEAKRRLDGLASRLEARRGEAQQRHQEAVRRKAELDALEREVVAEERRAAALIADNERRQQELEKRRAQAQHTIAQQEARKAHLDRLEQVEIPRLQAEIERLRREVGDLESRGIEKTHAQLTAECATLEKQLADLRSKAEELSELRDTKARQESERDALKRKIAQLEHVRDVELPPLQERVAQLQGQQRKLLQAAPPGKVEQLEQTCRGLGQECRKKRKEVAQLRRLTEKVDRLRGIAKGLSLRIGKGGDLDQIAAREQRVRRHLRGLRREVRTRRYAILRLARWLLFGGRTRDE